MVFDSNSKKSVLFGGDSSKDTWAWDGNEWQKITDIGPLARQKHDMCFNNLTNTILLFGGIDGGIVFTDTWEWDGLFWKQCNNFGLKPTISHAMTFDGKNPVLFGGYHTQLGSLGETWQWNGKHWAQILDIGPSPRSAHSMCTDTDRKKIVLFGGSRSQNQNDFQFNDTWELSTA